MDFTNNLQVGSAPKITIPSITAVIHHEMCIMYTHNIMLLLFNDSSGQAKTTAQHLADINVNPTPRK